MTRDISSTQLIDIHKSGNANSPIIVLLHPGGALHSVWNPFIREWSSQYRILALDLYAQGKVIPVQEWAEKVTTILRAEINGPACLIGSSIGANIALHITINSPALVSKLVLDS